MTIGIVCDNYKLAEFEKALQEKNLVYTLHGHLTPDTTVIKVMCEQSNFQEVKRICTEIERNAFNKKQKNN